MRWREEGREDEMLLEDGAIRESSSRAGGCGKGKEQLTKWGLEDGALGAGMNKNS